MRLNGVGYCLIIASLSMLSSPILAGSGKDLRRAASDGDLGRVVQLLDDDADPNSTGKNGGTPLIKATKRGSTAIVQLLLAHDADPYQSNDKGRSAIDMAERHERIVIASIMTDAVYTPAITIDVKSMTQEKFEKIMLSALHGRHWVIENSEFSIITARYQRKERAYKIETSLHNNQISIQFLKGYGSKNTNYLRNLKKDLKIIYQLEGIK